jgi:hypothetical protein
LYASPNVIRVVKSRRMRGIENVVFMGEVIKCMQYLVGTSEGKRPLGKRRRR